MPTKKVLLWDCLCLVLAFISFRETDGLASGSSNHWLISHRGRYLTSQNAVIWCGAEDDVRWTQPAQLLPWHQNPGDLGVSHPRMAFPIGCTSAVCPCH